MSFGGDYFSKKLKREKNLKPRPNEGNVKKFCSSQVVDWWVPPLGPNSVCLLLEKLDPHESVVCELVGPARTEAEALTTCPNKSPTEYYLPVLMRSWTHMSSAWRYQTGSEAEYSCNQYTCRANPDANVKLSFYTNINIKEKLKEKIPQKLSEEESRD
jgi:hypothetical protein